MFKHALFVLKNSPGTKLTANYYKDNFGDYCAIGCISRARYSSLTTELQDHLNTRSITQNILINSEYLNVYNAFNLEELGLTLKEAKELQVCNDDFEKHSVFPVAMAELNAQKERRYNHVIQWLEDKVSKETE